jgi:hypothetical protein
MKNLKKNTEELLSKLNAENGPVYEMQEDLEVVEAEQGSVEVMKSTFGAYLTITFKDKSKRMVNVRDVTATDVADDKKFNELKESKFNLQLWEAIRELPAQGNRRAIPKGAQRVFAIVA